MPPSLSERQKAKNKHTNKQKSQNKQTTAYHPLFSIWSPGHDSKNTLSELSQSAF